MKTNFDGFTIVELMIATAVFSIILLLATTVVIGITQTYIKGSVEDQTQQTSRAILTDISQDIKFNNNESIIPTISSSGDEYWFCIGNDVYVYTLDKELSSTQTTSPYSPWDLILYQSGTCPASTSPPISASDTQATIDSNFPGAEELLSNNERLGELNLSTSSAPLYTISVEVAYGANDLLNDTTGPVNGSPPPAYSYAYSYSCSNGPDSSFCAVSSLSTTVEPRVE